MIRRLTTQLPAWMQSGHPALRYVLGNQTGAESTQMRYTRALFTILLVGLFLASGYIIASNLLRENPFELPFSQMLSSILFWPAFVLQIALQLTVLAMTVNTVGEERRRQTWDSLRATSSGPALALRARWSAVILYRVRGLIGLLVLARLVLIAGILVDLTAFRGEYINYLIAGSVTEVPLVLGVLLLAFTMTASLLLPVTGIAFDAALGLLVSTFAHQRVYTTLAQITLVSVRMLVIGLLLLGITQFRDGVLEISDALTWLLLLAFAAVGDWGLSLLYLGFYGAEVWATVPYGIFLGLGMLLFVLVQAALTDGILSLAIYRAEQSD
jgi:hypothetical protein